MKQDTMSYLASKSQTIISKVPQPDHTAIHGEDIMSDIHQLVQPLQQHSNMILAVFTAPSLLQALLMGECQRLVINEVNIVVLR
jgi:hypothetical protein